MSALNRLSANDVYKKNILMYSICMTMKLKQDISLVKSLSLNFLIWFCFSLSTGAIIGSIVALFLFGLNLVTAIRISHPIIIFGLPLAGLIIGFIYHYLGGTTNRGNNLLLEEYQSPSETLPLKMVPLIIIGTWTTHLFGGSAGREGSAIQIGTTLADQIGNIFPKILKDRKRILLMGIAAGFAAVFGTPIAGFLFALEIVNRRIKLNFPTLIFILLSAFTAHYTCLFWNIEHTFYQIQVVPNWSFKLIATISFCAILFGLTARFFIASTNIFSSFLNHHIHFPPLIPFFGAILFIILYLTIGDDRFLGLGISTIQESFNTSQPPQVFFLKILFTTITLGSGFKGGEVTPLFFIGATLGSMLSIYFDLPIAFSAAIGFIAVLSGATKTPIACTFMGLELFGATAFPYFLIACTVSYLVSGSNSIYKSQNHIHFWSHFFAKIRKPKNS